MAKRRQSRLSHAPTPKLTSMDPDPLMLLEKTSKTPKIARTATKKSPKGAYNPNRLLY